MMIWFEFQGEREYQLRDGVFIDHPDQKVRCGRTDFEVVKRGRDDDGIPVLICRDKNGRYWSLYPEQCVSLDDNSMDIWEPV